MIKLLSARKSNTFVKFEELQIMQFDCVKSQRLQVFFEKMLNGGHKSKPISLKTVSHLA